MIQTVIVVVIVLGCVLYAVRRWWRMCSGKGPVCCKCGCCDSTAETKSEKEQEHQGHHAAG